MATPQFGLNYIEKPGANKADYAWRLYVAAYLAAPAALLYLLLPHSDPTSWGWVAVAGACLSVAVGFGVVETIRTTNSQEGNVTEPITTFVLGFAQFAAIVAMGVGITPSSGGLRWLLLVPALVAASVGNSVMYGAMASASLTMLVIAQHGAGLPTDQLGAELLGALFFVVMFRVFAVRVVASFARDLLFGTMSEVAATVDSLEEGWVRMLPVVCEYLEATEVVIAELGDRGLTAIVSWPGAAPDVFGPVAEQLTGPAGDSYEVFQVDGCIVAPLLVRSGPRIVAIVTGAKRRLIVDMYLQSRANQVAQQLGVLINRIQMIEGLELLTRTDSLTGLPNRRALTERLAEETDVRFRRGTPLCAVMIDLDHFKSYNDQFGHLEGDRALETVARFMSSRLRARDMVARYGGEEFAMILPETDVAGSLELLDEIRGAVSGLDLCRPLTISVGIARWEPGATSDTLLSHADQALYLAKTTGRDQCRVWDDAMVVTGSWIPDGEHIGRRPGI